MVYIPMKERRERSRYWIQNHEARVMKQIIDLVAEHPEGLSFSDALKLARSRGILSKPNAVMKYLKRGVKTGLLRVEKMEGGPGLPKTVYRVLQPSNEKRVFDELKLARIREKVFKPIRLDSELESLQKDPAGFWILFLLDAAKRAGYTEDLKTSGEKADFFTRLVDKTMPLYVAFGQALVYSADLNHSLVKSVLGSSLLSLLERKPEELESILRKRFEIAALDWAKTMTALTLAMIERWRIPQEELEKLKQEAEKHAETHPLLQTKHPG